MPSPKATQILIILFVTFGSLTYGYSSSIIGTTLGQPSFIKYFGLDTRKNATQLEGAINGLFQAGGLIGALSCTQTADILGRRKALFIGAIFALIGGALQAGSVNISMYIVMRFVTGLGVGQLVTLVPLYQSEIAPPKIRGLLVGTHGVIICLGYALAAWIGVGFYFVNAAGAQWRIPLAIQCFPPLFLALGVMFLPESPRWLLAQERVEEAYESFVSTRAEASDPNDEMAVRDEFNIIHTQLLHEVQNAGSFKDFFSQPSLRKRCMVGWLVMFAGQGTATQVINNYGPLLYSRLGFGTVQQLVITAGWVTVCPAGNWINAMVLDRFGRTRMLMFGFAGCVVALVGECITVSIFQRTGDPKVASAAVFFLFLHIACFSSSVDATSYVYASEIFPTPRRAKGLSISISGLFIATLIFLQAAPTAFENIGWKYYLVFVIVTAIMFFVVWFVFPETNKCSLEDIAEIFGDVVEHPIGEKEDWPAEKEAHEHNEGSVKG
ncbi:general substrate transporter [Lophium mytilinum]|uniref:General substrate transporter n=1 Tax=Lophium mytilinum TaxID=390894 RepID=A0A6A6R0M5_9PEZI|nr:general substrate transporter [Lophium mytilinum]